jgi:hypothetical protein
VSTASCPIKAAIEPTERLSVPHRKRLSLTYVTNDDGARELRIDYGLKEVSFDEEHLFAFGEQLVRVASFTGELATTWGEGYAWDELRPLLETLLDEGILKRGDAEDDPRRGGLVPSLVPPALCPVPRYWSVADCEAISRELGGRAVELGYLETIIPAFRIAHPALDGDDRQVGEASVYPPGLRLDRETEWRVCQYPGGRYRDEAPMNVTALKAMIKHWKPIMATILEVRAEVQRRLGTSQDRWAIGELYVLSCMILALPTFQLMVRGGATPQRPLHPVLSSLFRITDGVRMATDDMMFSIEHGRPSAAEPMTAAALHAYVEQHSIMISLTGVCAGPKPLIDEFLAAVIDGVPPAGIAEVDLPGEVRALLGELPAAIDYGLHAMQTWGVTLSVWLAMCRAYEQTLELVERARPEPGSDGARLRDRLRADWRLLDRFQVTNEANRIVHLRAYENGYEHAQRALRAPCLRPVLAEEIAPVPEHDTHAAAATALGGLLTARLADPVLAARITGVVIHYLREEQAILAATTTSQAAINALLDRPRPTRVLSVRDLHVNFSITGSPDVYPYLLDALDAVLGIGVACTATAIDVSDRRSTAED